MEIINDSYHTAKISNLFLSQPQNHQFSISQKNPELLMYVPDLQNLDNWDTQIQVLTTLNKNKDNLKFTYRNPGKKPSIKDIDNALRICSRTDYLDYDILLSADAFSFFFSIGETKNQKMIVKLQKLSKTGKPIDRFENIWHSYVK